MPYVSALNDEFIKISNGKETLTANELSKSFNQLHLNISVEELEFLVFILFKQSKNLNALPYKVNKCLNIIALRGFLKYLESMETLNRRTWIIMIWMNMKKKRKSYVEMRRFI